MRLVWKIATAVTVDIPGSRKEGELIFLNGNVNKGEELQIPQSLVLNLDQINLKYVYTDKTSTAKKGLTSVTIGGLSDKEALP